ncbi:MAG: hypothetical protein AAFU67_10220 [Bacteroidota bacterium]
MKILLVSWSVLPALGGSSVVIENLAGNFSAEEMIVLGSREAFPKPPPQRPASGPSFYYFFSELYLFGRGYRYFVWFRRWRFRPLVRHIKKLIREQEITHVVGVYPNPFYCYAACLAAREVSVPFSAYFHNTYVDNVAITDPSATKIQTEIFAEAQSIFVMSKGMQVFYEEKYQLGKFVPLVHTFAEFPPQDQLTGAPGTEKEQYKLVAIGNFNESNLDATRRLIAAIKNHPKYQLHIFTHVPQVLLRSRGIDTDAIVYEGFVPDEVFHTRLQEFDIAVLTHGFTGGYGEIEYRTIFPTRTIPLLLSGKPILAHSPRGSFLNDFIRENACAELIDEPDESAIIIGLDRIAGSTDRQRELIDAARQTAEQFYGPKVVAAWKKQLSEAHAN